MAQPQRILLVEDDPIIASILQDLLEDACFDVDGPHATLGEGMAAVAAHFPDGAVLDIRLKDRDVGLLAEDLENYDIPFLFCSGVGPDPVSAGHPDAPLVPKPALNRRLIPTLQAMLA